MHPRQHCLLHVANSFYAARTRTDECTAGLPGRCICYRSKRSRHSLRNNVPNSLAVPIEKPQACGCSVCRANLVSHVCCIMDGVLSAVSRLRKDNLCFSHWSFYRRCTASASEPLSFPTLGRSIAVDSATDDGSPTSSFDLASILVSSFSTSNFSSPTAVFSAMK